MRGLKLGKKLVRLWRRRRHPSYTRLDRAHKTVGSMGSSICEWGRRLKSKLCRARAAPAALEYSTEVPKGHLAVYVGTKELGERQRYLVPVIYFNHPLFCELLREAEEEFGFEHPGGITIPCPESEFESVRMRIAGAGGGAPITRKLSFKRLLLTSKRKKII